MRRAGWFASANSLNEVKAYSHDCNKLFCLLNCVELRVKLFDSRGLYACSTVGREPSSLSLYLPLGLAVKGYTSAKLKETTASQGGCICGKYRLLEKDSSKHTLNW